jgi:hypothetical protein
MVDRMKSIRGMAATIGIAALLAACSPAAATPAAPQTSGQPYNPALVFRPYDLSDNVGDSGIGVALGDLDGDGLADLVMGSPNSVIVFQGMLTAFGGHTELMFRQVRTISTPYASEGHTSSGSGIGVTIGDVNRDGKNDIIVGTPASVKSYLNTGGFVFYENQLIYVPFDDTHTDSDAGIGVTLADLNGDGWPDLVMGTPDYVLIFMNNAGKFELRK